MTESQRPIIWRNMDPTSKTVRVDVYADCKRRYLKSHPSNTHYDLDEWPVLQRTQVPHMDDATWYAPPGPGWVHDPAGGTPPAFPPVIPTHLI